MSRQRVSFWWFVGTLVFALLLMLVPLPHVLEPFKPYWPALVLLYWALESGDQRITLGLAFVLGVCADLLNGVLLGEQALRLCVLAFIALALSLALALLSDVAADAGRAGAVAQRPLPAVDRARLRRRGDAAALLVGVALRQCGVVAVLVPAA